MSTQQSGLSDLQQSMMRALQGAQAPEALTRRIRAAGSGTAAEALSIYRHSMQATRINALRLSYPIVERLVGAEFFAAAAARYAREVPSAHGDLDRYGTTFAEHLGKLPAAIGLPWLADLARFEWLLQALHRCPAESPLTRGDLANAHPAALVDRRFRLAPGAALFESRWPVVRIWQAHRDAPDEPDFDRVDDRPDRALICAAEWTRITLLDQASWAFFKALAEAATLLAAVDGALAIDPAFDFLSILALALDCGALVPASG